jgi:hypothetical protein
MLILIFVIADAKVQHFFELPKYFNGKVIYFLKTKNILVNPCISQKKLYIIVYMKADANRL